MIIVGFSVLSAFSWWYFYETKAELPQDNHTNFPKTQEHVHRKEQPGTGSGDHGSKAGTSGDESPDICKGIIYSL